MIEVAAMKTLFNVLIGRFLDKCLDLIYDEE